MITLLFAKRFVGDVWFPLLKDFDFASMFYDERDYGGTGGIYPSNLQGPMEIIDQPLNLQFQYRGLDVPVLDAQLKLDPDRRLLSWAHYDKRDHIEVFKGTHTFPHPKSKLQYRVKTGTLISAMHRFNRAT